MSTESIDIDENFKTLSKLLATEIYNIYKNKVKSLTSGTPNPTNVTDTEEYKKFITSLEIKQETSENQNSSN
jgi:hypothetical protein